MQVSHKKPLKMPQKPLNLQNKSSSSLSLLERQKSTSAFQLTQTHFLQMSSQLVMSIMDTRSSGVQEVATTSNFQLTTQMLCPVPSLSTLSSRRLTKEKLPRKSRPSSSKFQVETKQRTNRRNQAPAQALVNQRKIPMQMDKLDSHCRMKRQRKLHRVNQKTSLRVVRVVSSADQAKTRPQVKTKRWS